MKRIAIIACMVLCVVLGSCSVTMVSAEQNRPVKIWLENTNGSYETAIIVDENEVIQPWMKRYYCSECLEGGNQSWFKFCPNCGAKMNRGDGNSDMA